MDDDIEQQALDWHDRLERDPSEPTRRAFEAWRTADPRHAHAYEQHMLLATTARTAGWRGVMPDPVIMRPSRWFGSGIAVGAALATAAVVLVLTHRPAPVVKRDRIAAAEAGRDVRHAVRLADGSLVVLAAGGELTPGAATNGRSVRLSRGAARFIIMHDPAHPFVVMADGLLITARGTVFDVALTGTSAQVQLIEGRVDVVGRDTARGPARPVELHPGEVLAPGAHAPQPAMAANAAAPIGWLEVDGMTLGDIVAIASRGNGVGIAVADPALNALRVTGRFNMADSHALAAKLAAALDLHVVERDNMSVIGRR